MYIKGFYERHPSERGRFGRDQPFSLCCFEKMMAAAAAENKLITAAGEEERERREEKGARVGLNFADDRPILPTPFPTSTQIPLIFSCYSNSRG
jgi:hypothetical protein